LTRRKRWPPNKNCFSQTDQAADSGGLFLLKSTNYLQSIIAYIEIYVALQDLLCCHANKSIAPGIWYTYVGDSEITFHREE
jgi:hypothetical protein